MFLVYSNLTVENQFAVLISRYLAKRVTRDEHSVSHTVHLSDARRPSFSAWSTSNWFLLLNHLQ